VEIKDTIKGFEDISQGRCDDIPEQAFYMQGNIDDVRRKAETMAKG
jgi:F0F1-type ATP synthase beta subunit